MEWQHDPEFANRVARLCIHRYEQLPRKGKPQKRKQWTMLSGIVYTKAKRKTDNDPLLYEIKVAAIGTGSKCMGHSKIIDAKGKIIHDSHAEVMTRRAFQRFLYSEMSKVYRGKGSDILELASNNTCAVRPDVQFHMYTSHTPCGDASILPKSVTTNHVNPLKRSLTSDDIGDDTLVQSHKFRRFLESTGDLRTASAASSTNSHNGSSGATVLMTAQKVPTPGTYEDSLRSGSADDALTTVSTDSSGSKATDGGCSSVDGDIHRTGAKCVPGGEQDPLGNGVAYHTVGALRTKPGRGDRTLSMSCSDKIAKWNVVGLQGSLLSLLLYSPIYLTSVIVGKWSRCAYSEIALRRAIITRVLGVTGLPPFFRVNKPLLLHTQQTFSDGKDEIEGGASSGMNVTAASAAISWYDADNQPADVSLSGRKHGVTLKNLDKPEARCSLCKYEMYASFLRLVTSIKDDNFPSDFLRQIKQSENFPTYGSCKQQAFPYQSAHDCLLRLFNNWIRSPRSCDDFTL